MYQNVVTNYQDRRNQNVKKSPGRNALCFFIFVPGVNDDVYISDMSVII